MRTIYSVVIKVYRAPSNHLIVQGIKTAVTQVQEAMKDKSEETKDKLGPISVLVFNSVLKWVLSTQPKPVTMEQVEQLKTSVAKWDGWNE
eukprot:7761568-Karenia_brevis.AAC.1